MTLSSLDILVVDWEGYFGKVIYRLEQLRPLNIVAGIDMRHTEEKMPLFAPHLLLEEVPGAMLHMIFLGYDPSFKQESIKKLKDWVKTHSNMPCLVIVFNCPPKSWMGFGTARSKIEEEINKCAPNAATCIVKYVDEDEEKIPDGDLSALHDTLESYISQELNKRIMTFLGKEANGTNTLEETYQLSYILAVLGYYRESMDHYSKMQFIEPEPFWSESPCFYDIEGDLIEDLGSGFGRLGTSISGLFHSAVKTQTFEPLFEYVTRCFAIILDNCETEMQLVFSRYFINDMATTFANVLDDVNDKMAASFSLIALKQLKELFAMKIDWNDPTVQQIPEERKQEQFFENAFVTEWARSRRFSEKCPISQVFLATLYFQFLEWKNDKDGAIKVLHDHDIYPTSKTVLNNMFQTRVVETVYRWQPSEELAEVLVSSRASKALKLELLKQLKKIYPKCSIRPIFHAPEFFTEAPLFSTLHFYLAFSPPDFLVGEKATVFVKFKSHDHRIFSESQEMVLEKRTAYQSLVTCNYHGYYDTMILCVQVGESSVRWRLPNCQGVTVASYQNVPEMELIVPCLVSTEGEPQSALFVIDNIDTECQEMGVFFDSGALGKVFYANEEFNKSTELVLTDLPASLTFTLIMNYSADNQILTTIRYILKDGEEVESTFAFETPTPKGLQMTMSNQNEVFQQFQVSNPFQCKFAFEFNGKQHEIRPLSTYSIMRKKSPEPLKLVFHEEGWEEYPVSITTDEVKMEVMKLIIELDTDEWVVGTPRLATLSEPATVMKSAQNDWVTVSMNTTLTSYMMIPKRPGTLELPVFVVNHQVVECSLDHVDVIAGLSPPFVSL